jgi:hypothetical protein
MGLPPLLESVRIAPQYRGSDDSPRENDRVVVRAVGREI